MIRVVLDTNVIVSGLLAPKGTPARILVAWQHGAFEVVTSGRLLAELETVLARGKFHGKIDARDAAAFIERMRRTAVWTDDPEPIGRLAPDPGDDFVVAIALTASCAAIVSGDVRLSSLRHPRLAVLSPRDFLDALTG